MIIKPHDPYQQPLNFKIDEGSGFDSFIPGSNAPLVNMLKQAAAQCPHELYYIFGPHGCGTTHLFTALYRSLHQPPSAVFFLDLTLAKALSPVLLSIDVPEMMILDNVEAIAGDAQWELALFGLFNRWVDKRSGMLLVSAACSADRLPFTMPDLITRFENGVSAPLEPLNDEECQQALIRKAQLRGFKMPERVAAFIVRNLNRDMHKLGAVLNRLDQATLEAQHELTVPFVKKILEDMLH